MEGILQLWLKEELFWFTYILLYLDLHKINVHKVGEAPQAVTCEDKRDLHLQSSVGPQQVKWHLSHVGFSFVSFLFRLAFPQ